MELGGKNPAIVLEDADVEANAEELCRIAFENVGQNCAQPSRHVRAGEGVRPVRQGVRRGRGSHQGGRPFGPHTTMGPVVSKEQRDRIEGYIKTAIDAGRHAADRRQAADGAAVRQGLLRHAHRLHRRDRRT